MSEWAERVAPSKAVSMKRKTRRSKRIAKRDEEESFDPFPNSEKKFDNILEILKEWEERQPDKHLYGFIEPQEYGVTTAATIPGADATEALMLSYSEVLGRVRTVAYRLKNEWKVLPGDRVILAFPPSVEFLCAFLGCLWAGAIAVPIPAPNPANLEKDLPKVRHIVEDSGAKIVLTTGPHLLALRAYGAVNAVKSLKQWCDPCERWYMGLQWYSAGHQNYSEGARGGDTAPVPKPDDAAFLQYTSGSTAKPKGVVVSHRSLMHNMLVIVTALRARTDTIVVSWLPQFHDMGLIGSCLALLFCGGSGYYMSPLSFIKDPLLWLRLVTYYEGTHLQGPNFAYALCVKRARAWLEKASNHPLELNLASIKHVFNAAEQIRAETIDDFLGVFSSFGFSASAMSPGYGLAEHTVYVCDRGGTLLHVDLETLERDGTLSKGDTSLVSCGTPPRNANIEIVIVDTDEGAKVCDEGTVGEIWLSSESAASSYWMKPEVSAETLRATIPGRKGQFLRTGDLGMLVEGELYVTGRIKDVIIVRGRNHAPQDIEYTVQQACASFRPGCIAAVSTKGREEGLAILAEVRDGTPINVVQNQVSLLMGAVPQKHGITCQVCIVLKKGSLPKTTSGKLKRHTVKKMLEQNAFNPLYSKALGVSRSGTAETAESIFPAEGYTETLCKYTAKGREAHLISKIVLYANRVCGIDEIKPEENILQLGGDSLSLVQLHGSITASLDVDIAPSSFFENPSPQGIAHAVLDEFELEHPVAENSVEFHAHEDPFGAEAGDKSEGLLWKIVIFLQRKLVWAALLAIIYMCYQTMAGRGWDWWSQPRDIFEGPGIERGWIQGRYRDMYHGGLYSFIKLTAPLLGATFAIQVVCQFLCNLYVYRLGSGAVSQKGRSLTRATLQLLTYTLTGFGFSYAAWGASAVWLVFSALVNYYVLQLVRRHPRRRQMIWAWGLLYLNFFNTWAYYVPDGKDRTFVNFFSQFAALLNVDSGSVSALQWLDSLKSPLGLSIGSEYFTRYMALRLMSFNFDVCNERRGKRQRLRVGDGYFEQGLGLLLMYMSYLFYFPLIIRGPSMTFDRFQKQVLNNVITNEEGSGLLEPMSFRMEVLKDLFKLIVYAVCLEIAVHTFYYPTLIFAEIDRELNVWEWSGYCMAYLSFMYMQGIITYGFPRVIAGLNRISAPNDMPRCFFAASTSFSSHWRSYHAGWNKWFLQYIYLPQGGGYRALWYVCYWSFLLHSFDSYWVQWSAITTTALTVELFLRKNFVWYSDPNFIVRGINHAIVAWVHVYIFPGATDATVKMFGIGILVFMLIFEFSAEKKKMFCIACSRTKRTEPLDSKLKLD